MKRTVFILVQTLLIFLLMMFWGTNAVLAAPSVTLSPSSGIAAVTVTGSGFPIGTVAVLWDGRTVPTVPATVYVNDSIGAFSAIITVPTQTAPGSHTVTVRVQSSDGLPYGVRNTDASATFQVVDMKGLPGAPGQPGSAGPQGPAGSPGSPGVQGESGGVEISIAAILISLGMAVSSFIGKVTKWIKG